LRDLGFSQYCYWDATQCILVNSYRRFGGASCFILCTGRVGHLLRSVGKNSAIVISGFRREVDGNCVLLVYNAAGGGNSVPTIRDDPIFRGQGKKKKKKTVEGGTDRLSQNVGKELAAYQPRKVQFSIRQST
jgi:hypothetical protein